jgi:flagellar basal body-associated protein FliL
MKNTGERSLLMAMYRILMVVFIVLGAAWLGGTAWALLFRAAAETPAPSAPAENAPERGRRVFTGMGRQRLSLAGPSSAVAVVSVTFPYDSADRAFSEELASRLPDLRNAVVEYFGSFDAGVLQNMDETVLKAELLGRFNRLLALGTIEIVYFDDYMIID